MRWEDQRESQNVEDRRSRPLGRGLAIGGGSTIIIVLLISFLTGENPMRLLDSLGGLQQSSSSSSQQPGGFPAQQTDNAGVQDQLGKFASVVLASTEDAWQPIFQKVGKRYEEPRLVLFSDAVQSACGLNSAAVGPFYCPQDRQVYLDLSFFDELSQRFGAPGDFASAYVIAHEVGHHVQTLWGIAGELSKLRRQVSEREANQMSVLQELQADCLAGVWGHYADQKGLIEPGDFEEGLRAAAAIGDDRMQKLSQGEVQPESWTHGSSEQRVRWLRKGLQSGRIEDCDTFSGGG